ncbi:phosphotransferase family protein [Streptomyces botrytidirepellens]|uniref:Phosphotransferase family protein n=1 Tax=Streptomyces botrytidirepellens TaxID=2486417 RepID=A0A3M8SIC8_9ACTN|nr:phosphotransferase family protein [Streptomyces botrytidirepellens]RNF78652.1 phosphotransferase family protein [Streptomyces botrytidirepellens]
MSTATRGTQLAARVREHLARHHPGAPVGELTVLPGGHSGLTYSVTAGDARYVIKAVPPGQRPVGRNDVLRQARVLGALAGSTVPVPGVVAVDETEPAWFAMDFAPGEAVEPVLDEHEVPAATARARMLEIAAVLRRLHTTDVDTPGLGAPAPLDAAGELERWSRTLHAVPAELRPGGEELLARLADDVPQSLPPVLLHGDFRLGNVLCADERAVAVVDWEIWSVGDPRIDLGWFLLFADHRNFPRLGHPVPGLPGETELMDTYRDGRPDLPAMDWFRALGRMKMAAIMGHNLRRHREGKHHDPDQERLPPTIAAMIRTARDILG